MQMRLSQILINPQLVGDTAALSGLSPDSGGLKKAPIMPLKQGERGRVFLFSLCSRM